MGTLVYWRSNLRRAAMRNIARSASRRRAWWGHLKIREEAEAKTEEEEDGRFTCEGSSGRIFSEGHAKGSDRTEV